MVGRLATDQQRKIVVTAALGVQVTDVLRRLILPPWKNNKQKRDCNLIATHLFLFV
jgi:hypothetical protein